MPADTRSLGRLAAGAAALCFAIAAVLGVAAPSAAQSADGQVTSDKEGWWNRLRGAEDEAVPANPLGGTAPVPPPPTSVPEGAVAVGAALGEADKVGAIGVVLPIEQGGTVERLTMTLALAEGEGAQSGDAPTGAIQACPVTGFFVPEENGEFQNRPEADCALAAAPGTRNDDGSFSFDLTAIAMLWVDPAGTLIPNGVTLEPVVEQPTSFQVSFAGSPDGITFDFAGTPGEGLADPFDLGGGGDTSGGSFGGSTGGSTGGGSFGGGAQGGTTGGSAGGGSFGTGSSPAPPLVVPPVDAAAPPGPTTTPAATGDDEGEEVSLGAPTQVSQVGNTFGNLPAGTFIALLLGIGLALIATVTLGDAGAATVAPRRTGGVGRVLAQRSTGAALPGATATTRTARTRPVRPEASR